MKFVFKILKSIVVAILVAWIILIVVEGIRVRKDELNTKPEPFIVLNSKKIDEGTREGVSHWGLGYSIEYYRLRGTERNGTRLKLLYVLPVMQFEER